MKKRLWLTVTGMVTMLALGIGTTLALFSDSVLTNNSFTAGSLCLDSERDDGDRVPGPMFYITGAQGATPAGLPGLYPTGVWAPGDQVNRTLTVFNPASCSSMDAYITSIDASMHVGGYTPMADKLWVEVYTPQSGPLVKVAEGWMSDFIAGPIPVLYPDLTKVPIHLTANRHFRFDVYFDISADNSYQDKTLVVDFTVHAEQMSNNP